MLQGRSWRRIAAIGGIGAVVVGGAAYAAIPATDGTITACYKDSGIRLVDSAASCKSGETAITWNQRGPQGERGPTGPAGPQGPQGLTGADGPRGATGPAGPQGPQGPAGNDGSRGPTGPQGPAGSDGSRGPTGPQGPAGSDGAQGPTGPQGPAGNDGAQGPTGPQGPAAPLAGREVLTTSSEQAGQLASASLNCPQGKVPTGAGWHIHGIIGQGANGPRMFEDAPMTDSNGWEIAAIGPLGVNYSTNWGVDLWVVCADA